MIHRLSIAAILAAVFSVPLDYESHPRDGAWQVEGAPTGGIGVRF